MLTSLLTLLLLGLFAGIVFSVPVAGPIAILVISHSIQEKLKYVYRIALGSSIVEFVYVFLAMFGITSLLEYYEHLIPYLLLIGAVLILKISVKLFRTKISVESYKSKDVADDSQQGGLRTGIMVNLTNPTLFFGWLTSSFLLLSFASSIGLNTGGIEEIMERNIRTISEYAQENVQDMVNNELNLEKFKSEKKYKNLSTKNAVVLSLTYSIGVGVGSYFWFVFFSNMIKKFNDKFDFKYLNFFIKFLSLVLIGISTYFFVIGIKIIL